MYPGKGELTGQDLPECEFDNVEELGLGKPIHDIRTRYAVEEGPDDGH